MENESPAGGQQNLKEIARMNKNNITDIVFSITSHNNKTYFDIREFGRTDRYQGPTKKGLRINAELYAEFIEKLKQLGESL